MACWPRLWVGWGQLWAGPCLPHLDPSRLPREGCTVAILGLAPVLCPGYSAVGGWGAGSRKAAKGSPSTSTSTRGWASVNPDLQKPEVALGAVRSVCPVPGCGTLFPGGDTTPGPPVPQESRPILACESSSAGDQHWGADSGIAVGQQGCVACGCRGRSTCGPGGWPGRPGPLGTRRATRPAEDGDGWRGSPWPLPPPPGQNPTSEGAGCPRAARGWLLPPRLALRPPHGSPWLTVTGYGSAVWPHRGQEQSPWGPWPRSCVYGLSGHGETNVNPLPPHAKTLVSGDGRT